MRAFATFSASSGLQANIGKSALYTANVNSSTVEELEARFHGVLHFLSPLHPDTRGL